VGGSDRSRGQSDQPSNHTPLLAADTPISDDDPHGSPSGIGQRLSAYARAEWAAAGGREGAVPRRLRVEGQLLDGDTLPLTRLRYGGSAARWGFAMYTWPARMGTKRPSCPPTLSLVPPEDALDCATGLYLGQPTS